MRPKVSIILFLIIVSTIPIVAPYIAITNRLDRILSIHKVYSETYGYHAGSIDWSYEDLMVLSIHSLYRVSIALLKTYSLEITDIVDWPSPVFGVLRVRRVNNKVVAYDGSHIGLYSISERRFLWIIECSISSVQDLDVYSEYIILANGTHFARVRLYDGVTVYTRKYSDGGFYVKVKGKYVVYETYSGGNYYINEYNTITESHHETLVGKTIFLYDASPVNDLALVAFSNGTIAKISIASGYVYWRYDFGVVVYQVVLDTQSLQCILSSDSSIWIVNLDSRYSRPLLYTGDPVELVSFSPSSDEIVIIDSNDRLIIYDISSGSIISRSNIVSKIYSSGWVGDYTFYIAGHDIEYRGYILFNNVRDNTRFMREYNGLILGVESIGDNFVIKKEELSEYIEHIYVENSTLDYVDTIRYSTGVLDYSVLWDIIYAEKDLYLVYCTDSLGIYYKLVSFKLSDGSTISSNTVVPTSLSKPRIYSEEILRSIGGSKIYEIDLDTLSYNEIYSLDNLWSGDYDAYATLLSPNASLVVYVEYMYYTNGSRVYVVDIDNDEVVYTVDINKPFSRAIGWSSDGRFIALGYVGEVVLVDLFSRNLYTMELDVRSVSRLAFNPTSEYLLVITYGVSSVIVYSLYEEEAETPTPIETITVTETKTNTITETSTLTSTSTTTIGGTYTETSTETVTETTTHTLSPTVTLTYTNKTTVTIEGTTVTTEKHVGVFDPLYYIILALMGIIIIALIILLAKKK